LAGIRDVFKPFLKVGKELFERYAKLAQKALFTLLFATELA
jgi:hypothetical protein